MSRTEVSGGGGSGRGEFSGGGELWCVEQTREIY